ncbi:MAG: tRNA preQ1(34) S-adenosylmethionine ribosyltransferase-isomerase QueA [Cyanobacteria bacterium]|nr:tRNA preQ1(34) S-adenosylmethionine ribosyltransferase-isomerase QueA [Cyanobacteriota bacterium]MDW8201536.1 tRNA preQ1(34) S-adenosylmethionine ribosyltransferase-isomerase QueA [Cyanobacteriota bacterium SKYGB_h_bin112]
MAINVTPLDLSRAAYDYHLPEDLIAQVPAHPRDSSRLLVVDSPTHHSHHRFWELPDLLQPGDLLVMNNTKVLPARLYGRKPRGTEVEILLLEEYDDRHWLCLVKPGRRLKPGTIIEFYDRTSHTDSPATSPALTARVLATDPATNGRVLEFDAAGADLMAAFHQLGHVPLPPYITDSQASPDQYQTVYADRVGSVAAPTAGLHFTERLLATLQDRGIDRAFVTLHIGVGTFRPVEVEDITTHNMHSEWAEIPKDTVEKVRQALARGGRIIAVGTTSVRSLEGASQTGELQPFWGKTDLFIYPGYQWRTVQGLITNFHLPCSSLMMLVSAMIGRQRLLDLYAVAIAERYRFYSFGDAMLILPTATQA